MFTSDKDNERIIPRRSINFLKIGAQVLAVVFVLLFIGFDFIAELLPAIPQINYQYLIIGFLVLIFVLPGGIALFSKWLQTQKWLALAEEIGFQAQQANRFTMPTLEGSLRGHRRMREERRHGKCRPDGSIVAVQGLVPGQSFVPLLPPQHGGAQGRARTARTQSQGDLQCVPSER